MERRSSRRDQCRGLREVGRDGDCRRPLDQLVDVSRVRLVDATRDPASAYLGVAAGLGELDKALGALGVLGANVSMMVVGAVGTLVLQSLLMRMARRQSA